MDLSFDAPPGILYEGIMIRLWTETNLRFSDEMIAYAVQGNRGLCEHFGAFVGSY